MKIKKFFNYKNIVSFILLIGICLLGTYFLIGVFAFGTTPLKPQPTIFRVILFSFYFILYIVLIIFSLKKMNYKPSKLLFICLLIIYFVGVLTLLCVPSIFISNTLSYNGKNVDVSINLNFQKVITYLLVYLVIVSFIFLTFDVVPKLYPKDDVLYISSLIIIFVVLVFSFLSYFLDFNQYVLLFKSILEERSNPWISIKSIFPNKNSYGIILFIGIASSLYCHNKNPKFYYAIISVFFLINIFMSLCKTGIACSLLLMLVYFLYRFCLTLKANKKRNIIIISVISGTFLTLIVFIIICLFISGKIQLLIKNLSSGFYFGSLVARYRICYTAIEITLNTNALFGCGYHIVNDCLSKIFGTEFAHNGFVEVFCNGGVFLLVFTMLLPIYCVEKTIRDIKVDKRNSIFMLILLSTSLLYTSFESGNIVMPQTLEYVYLSMLIFVPIMKKHPLN